jgi:hypothetical protein
MTPKPSRAGGPLPTKTRLREPDGAAGGDFAWPPPADDPAGCSIVALEADPGPRRVVPAAVPDDAPMAWFPEIDVETALDAFADTPAAPPAVTPAALDVPRGVPAPRSPASRWRLAGIRGVIGLSIGASLALLPPPGVPALEAAPRPQAAGPLDGSVRAAPRTASRRARTPDGIRLAAAAVAGPRPGRIVPRDEDRIRATLAELGTAYSQLDAVAAREVWPSVDVDALARAFDDLQSQELRFDHCDVTVDGARARADCTGLAIYVPRIGDPVSISAARAWTFELTRRRQRWMIASGRAS